MGVITVIKLLSFTINLGVSLILCQGCFVIKALLIRKSDSE